MGKTVQAIAEPPPSVQRAKLKDQAYTELRRALIAGRFKPGEQVTIRAAAAVLRAGTMPAREAVQRLVAEGALVALPTGRVHVPLITRAEFEDVTELRLLLEPLAARKAARARVAALPDELAAWQARILAALSARDPQGMLWGNYSFHFAVYARAGSAPLSAQIEQLWLRAGPMIVQVFAAQPRDSTFLRNEIGLHDGLVRAIRRGRPDDAEAAMARVIHAAADFHRAHFPFAEPREGTGP